jgi:anti-sigma factor RsiW
MSGCPLQARLSAFYDHELDATTATQIESHLAACAECRETLEGLRVVSRALSTTGRGDISQIGMARLHATADDAARRRELYPVARALIAVAASVLVIAGAWLVETPAPTSRPYLSVEQEAAADWEKLASGMQMNYPRESGTETDVAFSNWMIESLNRDSGL